MATTPSIHDLFSEHSPHITTPAYRIWIDTAGEGAMLGMQNSIGMPGMTVHPRFLNEQGHFVDHLIEIPWTTKEAVENSILVESPDDAVDIAILDAATGDVSAMMTDASRWDVGICVIGLLTPAELAQHRPILERHTLLGRLVIVLLHPEKAG